MLRRVLTQTLIAGVLATGALAGSAANPGPDGKTIDQSSATTRTTSATSTCARRSRTGSSPDPARHALYRAHRLETITKIGYRLGRAQGNLPRRLTPLLGRDFELQRICAQLQSADLVTITGAGGVGKTRLAHQVGQSLTEAFEADINGHRWLRALLRAWGLGGSRDPARD